MVYEEQGPVRPSVPGGGEIQFCADIEIVVAFLFVNVFDFLVIARYHTIRISRKLEEIFLSASRSFLNQNLRNQSAGKPKIRGLNFEIRQKFGPQIRILHKKPP